MPTKLPLDILNQVKAHAARLESVDSNRLGVFKAMDDMYMMNDPDLPDGDWIHDTVSPEARNAEDGVFRLLAATDPIWSVPKETNDESIQKDASDLEEAARTIWDQAGKIQMRPVHFDAIRTGIHYGELHILIHSTKSLVDLHLEESGSKNKARQVAERVPALFEVINPRYGFPEWGLTGLTAYYSKRDLTVSDIRSRYGIGALASKGETDTTTVHDYWSLDYHVVWADGEAEPYVAVENTDAFIPVAAVLCEGGMIFNIDGNNQSRQPFLFTAYKSNIWKNLNLSLTVMNSQVFYIGARPLLVYEGAAETVPDVDRGEPGGIIKINTGEKLYTLAEKIIDPTMISVYQINSDNFERSTIYRTATGGMIGPGTAYSTVALTSQQGRLPTIVYQRMISLCLGEAMRIAFYLAKKDKASVKAKSVNGLKKIEPASIPDWFDLNATLEVDQASDDRVNSQVAAEGVKNGLWSRRYGREKYSKIGQSNAMDAEVWGERFADLNFQLAFQEKQQLAAFQLQQKIQALQAKAQQGNQPGGGPPAGPGGNGAPPPGQTAPGGPPQGMPGEAPPPDVQGVQPGLPMGAPAEPGGSQLGPGGLPPDQQGGMG